jgi:capsid assembly protease
LESWWLKPDFFVKNYSNIISKLFYEPALITPARHAALCLLLDSKLVHSGAIGGHTAPTEMAGHITEKDIENALDDAETLRDYRDQKAVRLMMTDYGSAAKISVKGTLVAHPEDIAMSECGCAMEHLNTAIDLAENNPAIDTIIFQFDTPGGTVTRIPETGNKILSSRKRTIAFTDSECCSGGIWLASQCQQFYATQSSRVGSVGVYTMCLDYTKALKKDGVKINAISAGKYKLLGAYWKELADEERKILQDRVDKIYAQFREAMESHRVVNDENFGNALVFDGDEAAEIGFTDGVVESMDELLEMQS